MRERRTKTPGPAADPIDGVKQVCTMPGQQHVISASSSRFESGVNHRNERCNLFRVPSFDTSDRNIGSAFLDR